MYAFGKYLFDSSYARIALDFIRSDKDIVFYLYYARLSSQLSHLCKE